MIIKNITGKQVSTTSTILPFKKNIFPNKINKTIEIVFFMELVFLYFKIVKLQLIFQRKHTYYYVEK